MRHTLLILFALLAFSACQSQSAGNAVPQSLVSTPGAAGAQPLSPPAESPTRLVVEVIKPEANLRDAPGTAGRVLSTFTAGTLLTVKHPERGGPWYEVVNETGGQKGWIHGNLIRFKTEGTAVQPFASKPAPTVSQAPTPTPAPVRDAQADTSDNVRVWVNTNSGVYHCPGTRWYGITKEGEYMKQFEAEDSGYRAAYGRRCY
jgi:hypothetical protein